MEIFNSYTCRAGVKRKDRTKHVNFKAICIAILLEFLRRNQSLRDSCRVRVSGNGRGRQMDLKWGRGVLEGKEEKILKARARVLSRY